MAVEEKVRENIPQAEGEAQGVRYISLTEEELDRLMKAAGREGAKKGVEAYERRKEKGVGAWVNPLSGKPEEYEFLLNRGTDFLVTDIGQDGADTIIRMKVTGRTETEWSYATKEEVIEQWKRRGVYSEESAKLL